MLSLLARNPLAMFLVIPLAGHKDSPVKSGRGAESLVTQ